MDRKPLHRESRQGTAASGADSRAGDELVDGQAAADVGSGVPTSGRVRELEAELEATRAELAELRGRWADWLAIVSHDLRSPLTLVLGYAQNLLRHLPATTQGDIRARQELESIVSGARRVDQMISQVVDGARLEADLLQIERRELDLAPLVKEEVRKARRRYPDRSFRSDIADSLPPVVGDARRAAQIVASLISNAVLYSPPEQPIEVQAKRRVDRVVVGVRDKGIGLTESEQPRVFERSFRSERAGDVRREGLGLSLSIARDLAERLGGELWVESTGPDRGASFYLALPLLAEEQEPPD